jgi:hypothetical protein
VRHRFRHVRFHALPLCALALAATALPLHAQQQTASPAATPAALAAQVNAPATPAPTVPFPNRVNEVMPSWLRVRGEFRERVEGFDNLGFSPSRDDVYYLSRFRFNAVATTKHVAATVQLQDARVGRKSVGTTGTPFTATFDLRQAFADLGKPASMFAARVGRQELAYGDQRLLGHVNWLNAGRTFDAARLTLRAKPVQVDVFAASVVRILDGEFDKSGAGNRLFGAYATSAAVLPKGIVEPYVIFRRDANLRAESLVVGSLSQVTTGARLLGRLPASLDYNIELAVQAGSLASDDVRAWAGHWQLRRTFAGRMAPHITGEYNYASGDRDPVDGTRGTFDQLYPTPHDKLGLADQVSWKNVHHLRAGFDVLPFRATPISVNYHSFWLAEARDALYTASGAPLARIVTGALNTHVGHEIDVQVTRPLNPQIALAAGYSYLHAGAFLKEATPGRSYSGPFVMLTYVFLADK